MQSSARSIDLERGCQEELSRRQGPKVGQMLCPEGLRWPLTLDLMSLHSEFPVVRFFWCFFFFQKWFLVHLCVCPTNEAAELAGMFPAGNAIDRML